jgi:hypothetical protein
MNLLQDLGGFVNSVLVGGRIVMFIFIDSYFYANIMKHIYQVETNDKGKIKKRKSRLQ